MGFRDNTGDVTYLSSETVDINDMQPTPIVYPTLYPENFAGTNPVMISKNTTLNEVVDLTFDTDAAAALVSGSINTRITAVSGSIDTRITAVSASAAATYITSASMVNTLASFIVYGGPGGGHINDAAAALNGCPIGGLYHTNGAVKVRLT